MILDGELGMPMELCRIREGEYGDGEYWKGNRSGELFGSISSFVSSLEGSIDH